MERTDEEIPTEKALVVIETSKHLSVAIETADDDSYGAEPEVTEEEVNQLQGHLKQHEEVRDAIRKKIAFVEDRLRKRPAIKEQYEMMCFEDSQIAGLEAMLRDAQAELHDLLRKEMQEQEQSDDDVGEDAECENEDSEEIDDDQYEDSCNVEEEQSEERTSRNVRRVCKSLFSKIAARTHPDKVKDPQLHELFIAARAYYKAFNVAGLTEIWEAVQGGASSYKASKLRKLRDKLLSELREVVLELEAISQSSKGQLVQMYQMAGEDYAAFEYRNMISRAIQRMQIHREQVVSALSHVRCEIEKRKGTVEDGA